MISVTFKSDFNSDELEKKIIAAAGKQLKERLTKAGVSQVTVVASKKAGEWAFAVSGPDDQVKKARDVLSRK